MATVGGAVATVAMWRQWRDAAVATTPSLNQPAGKRNQFQKTQPLPATHAVRGGREQVQPRELRRGAAGHGDGIVLPAPIQHDRKPIDDQIDKAPQNEARKARNGY